MTDKPLPGTLVIGRDMLSSHIFQDNLQNLLIFFHPQKAQRVSDNIVRPSRIESGNRISLPVRSYRILRLIPVMKWIVHSHHRFHDLIDQRRGKSPDSNHIVPDLILLELELCGIIHDLNLTASALPVKRAGRLPAAGGRLEHLFQPSVGIILFHPGNPDLRFIADHRILNKKGIAVNLSYPFALMADVPYFNCNYVVLLIIHITPSADAIPFWLKSDWNQTVC